MSWLTASNNNNDGNGSGKETNNRKEKNKADNNINSKKCGDKSIKVVATKTVKLTKDHKLLLTHHYSIGSANFLQPKLPREVDVQFTKYVLIEILKQNELYILMPNDTELNNDTYLKVQSCSKD